MGKFKPGPGRKSKGDRDLFVSRVPRDVANAVRREADRLDLSLSEYIANVLAKAHGYAAPTRPDEKQETLPMSA